VDQLVGLNEKVEEYAKQNTKILAITTDPLRMSEQAVQAYNIQIPVMYDPNQKVGKQYGVTDVPGGMDMGPVDTHSIFVIDQEGTVSWYEISPQEMYVPEESIDKELQKVWE
jgi:peroxiredoxin